MFRRLLANRVFILVLVTLLIVAVIFFDSVTGNPVHVISTPVSLIVDPVQKVIRGTGNKVGDFFSAISDGMKIREENQKLQEQVAELQYQVQQGEVATRRWEELKDAFHIQDSFENYDIYGASVLSREADEWFSVFRVDAGTHSGISITEKNPSYAVVDAQMNLVGRVLSTDLTSSKVMPILHEGFSVSAKVNSVNGAVVNVHGEIELKEKGLCMVDSIPERAELKVGDELVTSGKGGLFPAGIPIGVIVSIDDSSALNRTATVKPYSDISALNDCFIMVPGKDVQTDSGDLTGTPTPAA